jgi:hypothetical protein
MSTLARWERRHEELSQALGEPLPARWPEAWQLVDCPHCRGKMETRAFRALDCKERPPARRRLVFHARNEKTLHLVFLCGSRLDTINCRTDATAIHRADVIGKLWGVYRAALGTSTQSVPTSALRACRKRYRARSPSEMLSTTCEELPA